MKQVLIGGVENIGTAPRYSTLVGFSGLINSSVGSAIVVPVAGTFSELRIFLSAAPGAGNGRLLEIWKNGVASGLSVTISNTDTTGVSTGTLAVSAGDYVCLKHTVAAGSPAAANLRSSVFFESDAGVSTYSLIGGNTNNQGISNTATRYAGISGANNPVAAEADAYMLCPAAGTLRDLYVRLSADPGAAPDAYTITIKKNGVSTALTTTIVANDVAGNDTTHTVSVAAGDLLSIMFEPVEAPSASPTALWGLVFIPDTAGDSIIMGGCNVGPDNQNVRYQFVSPTVILSEGFEAARSQIMNACTIKALYAETSVSPYVNSTTEDKWGFKVRKNGADTDVAVEIVDGGTGNKKANDTAHTAVFAAGDSISLQITPSSSPATMDYWWGVVISFAAGTTYNEALTLAVSGGMARSATAVLNAGLSLGISADQGTGNVAEMDAVIALSLAMAMLQAGDVTTGAQTYEEAIALAAAAGMSQTAVGNLQEAVTLALAVGQEQAGQSVMVNALVLQATASMIQSAVGSLSASLNLDVYMGEDFGTALILQASVLLGTTGGLSASGGLSLEDAATLGINAGMTQIVGYLLSAAVELNVQASQAQSATLTAEAQLALSIACDQIDSIMGGTYNVSLALSIVADMAQWGIVPRIAAARHLYNALARKREYDAKERKREYDATARKREYDEE